VRRLLKISEVTGVFLGRDFISVNKKEDVQWAVSDGVGLGGRPFCAGRQPREHVSSITSLCDRHLTRARAVAPFIARRRP
jgi:hypothetical protein